MAADADPTYDAMVVQKVEDHHDSNFHAEGRVELTADCGMTEDEAQRIYDGMVELATDHHDLPLDVWGAMFFVIIKDFPDLLSCEIRHENLLRTVFVIVCYFLNIFLQVALVYWICSMVTLPAVRQAQNMYKEFHKGAFDEHGTFDMSLFHALSSDTQGEICQIVLSSELFLCSILFLWVAQCFSELRRVQRRVRLMRKLPSLPQGFLAKEMVAEASHGEGHFEERKLLLVCLNTTTRLCIYVLIFIPEILIACLLCLSGSIWLTASLSFGDLILNSLALGFVVEVDEIIFKVFLPPRLETNLSATLIACPANLVGTEEEREMAEVQSAYTRSTVFLSIVVVFVVIFVLCQPVLPGYKWDVRDACEAFNKAHFTPWCAPWNRECFPKG